MKLFFHLPYRASPGETLCAALRLQTGSALLRRRVPLECLDGEHWKGATEISAPENTVLIYSYKIMRGEKTVRREWSAIARAVPLCAKYESYCFHDFWRDLPEQSWNFTSALAPQYSRQFLAEYPHRVILQALIPALPQGQKPFLCGGHPALGQWDPQLALPLLCTGVNEWSVSLDKDQLSFPLEYKFILKDEHGNVCWEEGLNRFLNNSCCPTKETLIYSGLWPRFPRRQKPLAGVVLPVFSIRTEQDWGVGDFASLRKLVDWAALTGQKMIQILPVNDTSLTGTWQDSYPYNNVSVYAFHPMYADLSSLPKLSAKEEKYFETRRQRLNALEQVDYESVCQLKMERLRLAYKANGAETLESQEFKDFWETANTWLAPYAMFSALRDRFGTADFTSWPRNSHFSEQQMRKFFSANTKDRQNAYFYFYVQFLLHKQLLQVHHYAQSKNVRLKGDIPIGVSPHSADAWAAPSLFLLDTQAGAPPDDFSKTGQNWGFPTYNWDEMAKDNYAWWHKRFLHMSLYFDAYRIDHVLGFFRIWEIPQHAVQGLLGQFSPAIALSAREIAFAGFPFHEMYLRPYISEDILQKYFADKTEEIKQKYLLPLSDGLYAMKEEYNTQRKVEKAFSGQTDEASAAIRDGLYALLANVLFVTDRKNPQLYHPRISALTSDIFLALPRPLQEKYTALYNDYFYRRQDAFWKEQALKKLPALTQSTRMLCCAEDLGMIPHCVPEVMHMLQMLSLEIQRMPKRPGETFADTAKYPLLSVATPGTHDMSVLRGWWKENPALSARFWAEMLHRPAPAPADLPPDACEQIIYNHLHSPSLLCLIAWQDWAAMDEHLRANDPQKERINVPANAHHYWRYRMPISVEELLSKQEFNQKIKTLIEQSGRL